METPPSPSHVVIAYDATKERTEHELKHTVNGIRLRGDILRGGDTLVVLGVLHRVTHPSKCLMDCFNTETIVYVFDVYSWFIGLSAAISQVGFRLKMKIFNLFDLFIAILLEYWIYS